MRGIAWAIRRPRREARFPFPAQFQLFAPAAETRSNQGAYSELLRPAQRQFGALTHWRGQASQLDAHLSGNSDYADIEHDVEDFIGCDARHQDRLAGIEDRFDEVLPGRAA